MIVWILEEHGDGDYHGGNTVLGIYATEELANKQREIEEAKPNPCHPEHPRCDHKYDYSVTRIKVKDGTHNETTAQIK